MTAITAITAQNTVGVEAVEVLSPAMIIAQVRAVCDDIGVDAVKVGMLGTAATVEAVIEALDLLGDAPVVLDPVMIAESGAPLLDAAARGVLVERLLPLATIVTPNIPEAQSLTGAPTEIPQEELARMVVGLGPRAAVVTGGHSEALIDQFYDGRDLVAIAGERHRGGASHGSGCTHSSALAAMLSLGRSPLEAARGARAIASEAVACGLVGIGAGPGPVDVFCLSRRLGPTPAGAAD
jgi:hydroxymethylpyrimidine/phosphomethylpyrimidine kinase